MRSAQLSKQQRASIDLSNCLQTQDPTANMMDEKKATDDDAMRSSANALTKKLYLTVMDVFGNYVGNDEDDYNNMLETLRQKQLQKLNKCPTPAKSDDTRGIIAKKLLEGYTLHGDVCDKCVMPLMSYLGHVTCVVCKKAEELPKTKVAEAADLSSDVELALAATTQSDVSEEDEEELINKELSQFNQRRSQATHVYTSKILAGYVMQDQLCAKCDMPTMKYKDSVECVFCPKEVKRVTIAPVKEKTVEAAKTDIVVDDYHDQIKEMAAAAKPVKEPSQAEVIAERLRGTKSKGYGESIESELEKAESELVKMMEALGTQTNQTGEVSEALQAYFSQKKKERASLKLLKEAEDGILEAEAVAAQDEGSGILECVPRARRVVDQSIITAFVDENQNGVFAENGTVRPSPPTPQFESSISCSIGDSFFPSLKKMFASRSSTTKGEEVSDVGATDPSPSTGRLEAKKRIAMLVAEGWEVSADSCPQCELPLFSNSNGQVFNGMRRCVMCGPITENGSDDRAQGDSYDLLKLNKEAQEDITKKMVNRIMEGWSIVEGTNCPACNIPIMFDPQTSLTYCIACGAPKEPVVPLTSMHQQSTNTTVGDSGTVTPNLHTMQSTDLNKEVQADITKKMVAQIMAGWSVIEGSECPSCYMPVMFDPQTQLTHCVACGVLGESGMPLASMQQQAANATIAGGAGSVQSENVNPNASRLPKKQAMQKKLRIQIETDAETTFSDLPDPTVSNSVFKGQYEGRRDPEASMHAATDSEQFQLNTGAPTPATKSVRCKINEPTPNMQAVRNKVYAAANSQYTQLTQPTPNMQAVRNKIHAAAPPEPTPFIACDPTPCMQSVRGKLMNPTQSTQGLGSGLCIVTEDEPSAPLQPKLGNNPTPAMRTLRYKRNEPTPNMQAVRNKVNEPELGYHGQVAMHAMQGQFNAMGVSTANRRQARAMDPTPSNLLFTAKGPMEAPGHR